MKHRYVTFADKPGALDRELTTMCDYDLKILGFWRSGKQWVVKLMEPKP